MFLMFFVDDISRYIIATSCGLKNERNKKFFILVLFYFSIVFDTP